MDTPRVVVEDVGFDAVLLNHPDGAGKLLVLRPGQSFTSAVEAVRRQVPAMRVDLVRALVRQHLPGVADVHALWAADLPRAVPVVPARRGRRWGWMLAGLVAACTTMGTGVALAVAEEPGEPVMRSVFDQRDFTYYATRVGLTCDRIGDLVARCIEHDGSVGLAEAAVTNNGTMFMFSGGDEQLVVRAFSQETSARAFLRQESSDSLPNVTAAGRYVMWGSEPSTIEHVRAALTPARPQSRV